MADKPFVWSDVELNLHEVISIHQFPLIIRVSGGYYGDTAEESISNHEIFWLHSHDQHSRVIARDPSGKRVYSIPVSYPEPFLLQGQKKRMLLKDICETNDKPYNISPPESNYSSKSDPHKAFQLTTLKVEEEYKETFIKANAIREGCLNSNVSVIPCYVKATVVVAEGLQGCLPVQWIKYIEDIQKLTQQFDYSAALPDQQEIMLYSAQMVAEAENTYDTLEPKAYLSIQRKNKTYQKCTGKVHQDRHTYELLQVKEKPSLAEKNKTHWGFGKLFKHKGSASQEVIQGKTASGKDGNDLPGQGTSMDNGKASIELEEEYLTCNPSKEISEHQNVGLLSGPESNKKKRKFSSLSDVPLDLTSLSVNEVSNCLRLLSLSLYVGLFRENLVDGKLLCAMTMDMLVVELSMKDVEAMRLHKFIEGWRCNYG